MYGFPIHTHIIKLWFFPPFNLSHVDLIDMREGQENLEGQRIFFLPNTSNVTLTALAGQTLISVFCIQKDFYSVSYFLAP